MEFRILEDNRGSYRWTIVARGGRRLVQSESFGSYDDAEHAARVVRDGAGSARFERRPEDDGPVDLIARREAASARDDLDAERWLDEGGSFNREAAAQWPAGR